MISVRTNHEAKTNQIRTKLRGCFCGFLLGFCLVFDSCTNQPRSKNEPNMNQIERVFLWSTLNILLHSSLPRSTLLYSILRYSTLLYSKALPPIAPLLCVKAGCGHACQPTALLYSTLLFSTLLYSTLLYSTLLYCTRPSALPCPRTDGRPTDRNNCAASKQPMQQ